MDAKELESLGFTISGGQIDYKNKNYGRLSPSGPLILPEGEDLIAELRKPPEDDMPETDDTPRKPGRPRKTE